MADRGADIKQYWDKIDINTDILITHGPPHGILDEVNGCNVGCEELLLAVQRIKPKYHIFGHIHEGYGQKTIDGTTYINCSHVDGKYRPVNQPIRFEI